MQSMAISLSDALGRTSEGDSELAQARHGLSVAQRKLLSQLGNTSDLDTVAREFGWDAEYANRTATRLVELGLVERRSAPAVEQTVPDFGGARVLSIERGAPQRAKHWPILAAVVVLGAIAAFWFSRSATAPAEAPAAPAATAKDTAKPAVPAANEQKPVALPNAVYSMTLRETQATTSPAAAQAAPAASAAHAPATTAAPALATAKPAPALPAAATPQVATRGLTSTAAQSAAPKTAAPAAAVAEAPKAAPVVVEPAAPKTLVASAAPSSTEAVKPSAPAVVDRALKVVSREAPGFPREALLANVNSGTVKARMTVDGNGNVVKVEVLDAQPRRVFDREVQRTLSKWKFEPTGQTQTAETEVVFNRE